MSEASRQPVSRLPKWHEFMAPLLAVLSNGREWQKRGMEQAILDLLKVPQDQREESLESGQFRAINRIGWATSKLRMAKAIVAPRRVTFQITEDGLRLLSQHPDGISVKALESIPAFQEYIPTKGKHKGPVAPSQNNGAEIDLDESTPDERIRAGVDAVNDDVKAPLLMRLHESDPYFFEQVVRQVLIKMGYGVEGELRRLAGSGDSGIDGVIDRDELGLSRIYIQAKRYAEDKVIGRPMLQGFFGALVTREPRPGSSLRPVASAQRLSTQPIERAKTSHSSMVPA